MDGLHLMYSEVLYQKFQTLCMDNLPSHRRVKKRKEGKKKETVTKVN